MNDGDSCVPNLVVGGYYCECRLLSLKFWLQLLCMAETTRRHLPYFCASLASVLRTLA